MKFNVLGSDPRTGRAMRMVVEADDLEAAAAVARSQIRPTSITAAPEPAPPPVARIAALKPRSAIPKVVAFSALLSFFLFLQVPIVPALVGAALLGAVALFVLVPGARRIVRRTFGMSQDRPVFGTIKLVLASGWGIFLLLMALGGTLTRARDAKVAVEQRSREELIDSQVKKLVADAESALQQGNIDAAADLVHRAAATLPKNPAAAELRKKIATATGSANVLEILQGLPEPEFTALRESGTTPAALSFGYPALDARALELARAQVEQVAGSREKARAEQEAKLAERRRQVDAEAAQRNPGRGDAKEKLDAYAAALERVGSSLIDHVKVRSLGDEAGWEATVTVTNLWHIRHRQVRLQDAQALWRIWANIACPSSPDAARLSVVDLMGNEVGGSRIWAGSLIWVDD